MISVIPTQITTFRAFGWVQDPSNFRSLCDVVAIFDNCSAKHKELINFTIPSLVSDEDGRQELINALNTKPLKISYAKLVGTAFSPRSNSRCNGIVQATVKGQKRPFIGDWPADNFVRWAYAFGFIKYNYTDDTFGITPNGLALTAARLKGTKLSDSEKELLIDAILSYPPAVRILNLLSKTENEHLTKFEIGKQLGFVGEGGFTSLPQSILIKTLATTKTASERNKMKTDWDGSSDKYARMISKWLVKLDLVEQVPKKVTVKIAEVEYSETIGQAYVVTAKGITAINRTIGKSRHKRIPKNVCFEMLATKGDDREYLRTRRAYILKFISESKHFVQLTAIIGYLALMKLNELPATVKDDIQGLVNIGINIIISDDQYKWNDEIIDFIIPLKQSLAKSELTDTKEQLRTQMTHLSHEYLSLIDLAYDGAQNRLFEMKTIQLFTEECEFSGFHLGGSRKPDGVLYTTKLENNFGVIVDTKSYSAGYRLPISQADEMERYIRENQSRDKLINPNKWWLNFENDIEKFYFMFVSGHFVGKFTSQLERISRNTKVNGTALSVTNLLVCANSIKSGVIDHNDIDNNMFNNTEYLGIK